MASFTQNIRKIRGEAISGPDMRTAIADAITQAMNLDLSGSDVLILSTERIGASDDYVLVVYSPN